MRSQKFIFHSKTLWSAILTLAIAILPLILEDIEKGFSEEILGSIIALTASTLWTIYNRYIAHGNLYTTQGLPGRNYVSPSDNY